MKISKNAVHRTSKRNSMFHEEGALHLRNEGNHRVASVGHLEAGFGLVARWSSMNFQKRDQTDSRNESVGSHVRFPNSGYLTQGQKALVVARLLQSNSGVELAEIVGVNRRFISEARTILEWAA